MKKRILNILIALVIMFIFTVPASASNGTTDTLEKLASEVKKASEISDEKQKDFFVNKVENLLKDIKGEAKGKEKATLHIDTEKISFSEAKLLKYENEDNFGYVVSFPVDLENSHEMSNVTFVFDDKKKFLSTTEMYLTENSEGNFNIAQYFDGEESVNLDTDLQFETAEEFRNNQPEISPLAFDINKLASCLGISVGLATIIASVCGVGCYFTGGLGCLACLSFVAGFNIGGGISCFQYAWY